MPSRIAMALARLRPDAVALTVLLASSLLLWTLAYQVSFTLRLAVGGDTQSHRREDDAPFLRGFHASQPASQEEWRWWLLEPGYGYRWTEGDATIEIPGIGGGFWLVSLHAGSGRPDNQAAESIWQVGQQPALALDVPSTDRVYSFLAPADAAGNLSISFDTQTFTPPADPRALGFVLREVRVVPTETGARLPALAQASWLALLLLLVYGLARWLVFGVRGALALGLALAALAALLLAYWRMSLTLLTPALVGLAVASWTLAALAWVAVGGWPSGSTGWRAPAATRQQSRLVRPSPQFAAVVALALLAFVLRASGMLHPHAIFSDHLLNANNLLELARGDVYFAEGLPDDSGGGDAPYPPGLYVLLAPVLTFVPAHLDSRALIVQLGTALLDSLVLVLLWLLLRRAGLGQRAALFGAALYLLPESIMPAFSIGNYANLGGQVLMLPVLTLLALGRVPASDNLRAVPVHTTLLLALLLTIGLLGHMGVTISLALLMLAAWLLSLAGALAQRGALPGTFRPGMLTIGGLIAALTAGVLYYSAPEFLPLYAERLADDATSSAGGSSLLAVLWNAASGLFTEYSRLLPLTVLIGLAGALLLWVSQATLPRRRGLTLLLLAWWLGVLFSFGLQLIASQGVRWEIFIYPALCLGGGALLAALWRRGIAGRVVACSALLMVISHGLMGWIWQIYTYLH